MVKLQRIAKMGVVALGLALGVTGSLFSKGWYERRMALRQPCETGWQVTPLHDPSIAPPYNTIVQLEPQNKKYWTNSIMTFNINCDLFCIQNLVLNHIGILSNGLSAESTMRISGGRLLLVSGHNPEIPYDSISSAKGYKNWKKCVKTSEWTHVPSNVKDSLGIFRLVAVQKQKLYKCEKLFNKLLPGVQEFKPLYSEPFSRSAPDPSAPDPYEMVIQLLPPEGEELSMQLKIQYDMEFVQTLVLRKMGILSDDLYKTLLAATLYEMSGQIVIAGATEESPKEIDPLTDITYGLFKERVENTEWDLVLKDTQQGILHYKATNQKKYEKCLKYFRILFSSLQAYPLHSVLKSKHTSKPGLNNPVYEELPTPESNYDFSEFDPLPESKTQFSGEWSHL